VDILMTVRKIKDGQVVAVNHLVTGQASPAVLVVSSA
jgi:hypothetical protein